MRARILHFLSGGLASVGAVALLIMTSWTIIDIFTRYLLTRPLRGSIDLVESTLVLVVFLALPECFRRNEQITVDVLVHVSPPRVVAYLKLFAVLATLLFVGLLCYTGIQPFLDALRFGDRKPELPIPIAGLLGAIELALIVSAFTLLANAIKQFKGVLRREMA